MRGWYEVRVRECIVPSRFVNGKWVDGRWVKKSKFYRAKNSQDAVRKYKGNGLIMYSQKVERERQLGGVGDFFRLGDELLRELRRGGDSLEVGIINRRNKSKRGYRG